MLSKLGGTLTALPPGLKEFPMFPGITYFVYIFYLFIGKFCQLENFLHFRC